jgi:hypothetical protein
MDDEIATILLDTKDKRITDLESELAALESELTKYRKDRLVVVEYLKALAKCRDLHPEGYTIVDFQSVWLEQERDRNRRLKIENIELRRALEQHAKEINGPTRELQRGTGRDPEPEDAAGKKGL